MATYSFYSVIEVGDLIELSIDKIYIVTNVLKDKTTGEIFIECGKLIFPFRDVRIAYRKNEKTNFWYKVYCRMY